jgi:HEAT repeat protein
MNFKPSPETLGAQHIPVEKKTSSLLRDALATFSANRVNAMSTIQELQSSDLTGLAMAAVQLLVSSEEKSPALQYVAGLLTTGSLLADLLMNRDALSLEAAVALARKVAAFDRRLDVHLMHHVTANATSGASTITSSDALRLLGVVDAISDCLLLASYLVQFLRHPSNKVRSKAALMLGRSNRNLHRVESLLASPDSRLRANAVESLWAHRHDEDVRKVLWNATRDQCGRVVVNALLGLCQAGDREAYAGLAKLANISDPVVRCSAAWAMGETGDPEFCAALEKLGQDRDAKVREMADKSRAKLRARAYRALADELRLRLT